MQYVAERFTAEEAEILRPYFTNLDAPVFALVNLPGGREGRAVRPVLPQLARACGGCSSTSSSATSTSPATSASTPASGSGAPRSSTRRSSSSTATTPSRSSAGVHLACEQASNVLTKILEWGRLMAYLEQSTRYIPYDSRLGGRYRFYRPAEVLDSPLGARYVADMDALFDDYAACMQVLLEWARDTLPEGTGRLRLRLQEHAQGQGLRRSPGHPPGRHAVERRHLRHRSGVRGAAPADARPPAAGSPEVLGDDARRAPQGHPVVPHPRRPTRPGCRLERIPRARRAATRPRSSPGCSPTDDPEPRPVGRAHRLRPRR